MPRDPDASHIGALDLSLGAAWTDYTSASLDNAQLATGTKLAGLLLFSHLSITNRHATQAMFLMFTVGAGATTHRIRIEPATHREVPCLGPEPIKTISLQGAGAATVGSLVAFFSGT